MAGTRREIEKIAARTTGQLNNPEWHASRRGKPTASIFGRALHNLNNPHETTCNLETIRHDVYYSNKLDHVAPIKWGIEHEQIAIDAYVFKTDAIVEPTGIWVYPNGIMSESPNGLVNDRADAETPSGIIEVVSLFAAS